VVGDADRGGKISRVDIEERLVPEGVLERLAADFGEEWVRKHVAPGFWSYREVRFLCALEHFSRRLPVEYQDVLRIYYTSLYWANRLVAAAQRDLGPDAGLEQWAHNILVHPPDGLVDWGCVEEIFQATKDPLSPPDS
jgi:hypothetical protein